jgi:hypothetical protein
MKKLFFFFCSILMITGCMEQNKNRIESKLKELEALESDSRTILAKLQEKDGEEYISLHNQYYALQKKRLESARRFAGDSAIGNLEEHELQSLSEIATIGHDEERTAEIIASLFDRFPETKNDMPLIQSFFSSDYLLNPKETEGLVNFSLFSTADQLYCLYMLALGFAESGETPKAAEYIRRAEELQKTIEGDPAQKNSIPELYIAGLDSFINALIGENKKAIEIVENAKEALKDESSLNEFNAYQNRLAILNKKALPFEYQYWINTNEAIDIAALKGSVLLLAFFTSDCEECVTSIPILAEIRSRFQGEKFMMIGITRFFGTYESMRDISEKQEYELIRDRFCKERKISWPICMTRQGVSELGITSVPTYLLVDKYGIIRDGYYISNYSYLKKKIRSLLDER